MKIDLDHFRRFGWVRIERVVPVALCERLTTVLETELGVPIHDAAQWDEYGGDGHDLLPIWGHQAQWDIRQHPQMHHAWSVLCGTDKLYVSLDSCRFTPPWRHGYAEPHGIHWDHDPWNAAAGFLQGVLALTETAIDQGGFRCAPSLCKDRAAWPKSPVVGANGEEDWLADTAGRDIIHVAAAAGDLIAWDSRLPHGNSKNLSSIPRLAFYILMGPANDPSLRQANIESWRSGRCVPWWCDRRGYGRREPWPPADLTPIGRKLLGLDDW
jgi:hypothetical protein